MNLRRVAAAAGIATILAAVGGPAAVASYRHASKVAHRYGETEAMANWLPLTTDGMLVAALVVMYSRRWNDRPTGRGPWIAFASGTVATLAANLAAADITTAATHGEVAGRLAVAVWPPIAFALTLELVAMLLPGLRAKTAPLPPAGPATTGPVRARRRTVRHRGPVRRLQATSRTVPKTTPPDVPDRTGRTDRKRPGSSKTGRKTVVAESAVRTWIEGYRTDHGALPARNEVVRATGCGGGRASDILRSYGLETAP